MYVSGFSTELMFFHKVDIFTVIKDNKLMFTMPVKVHYNS